MDYMALELSPEEKARYSALKASPTYWGKPKRHYDGRVAPVEGQKRKKLIFEILAEHPNGLLTGEIHQKLQKLGVDATKSQIANQLARWRKNGELDYREYNGASYLYFLPNREAIADE